MLLVRDMLLANVPDLSGAPGFQESYVPPANAMGVGATGAAIVRAETATSSSRTTSTTSSTLPVVGF